MQPYTGHLIASQDNVFPEGYFEVPFDLRNAAIKKLNGNSEAMVSLKSGGKLSNFARDKRKAKKAIAKASKRANRNK
jgi:hypothetical protein